MIGIALLPVPLLGDFHFESAALAALIGAFWAGWSASAAKSIGLSPKSDFLQGVGIAGYIYLVALPLLIFSLINGCFSIDGLGFWVLFPLPSVFFGYSIGRLIRRLQLSAPKTMTIFILLLAAAGELLLEFFSFPQVYFFNHVWGSWPGPIYDEAIHVTGSLLYFRMMSLLWIVVLWYLPDFFKNTENKWMVGMALLSLLLSYTHLPEMGIISPRGYIRQQLGGHLETPHFQLYYDKAHYSDTEIQRIALKHEFYLDQITRELEVDKPDSAHKIESYLYAHAWQKKRLVGAKFTSYVPVWLKDDQLHIAKQQIASSLKHELAHVVAKQFGNRWIHASWSIGLIEGLAVAVAPDESPRSTINQIVAADKPWPDSREMQDAFSFWGFYGGRATVNYTTSGSFVQFLLNHYTPERIKQAYRSGNVANAYPVSFDSLVAGWHRVLKKTPVDTVDRAVSHRLFSQLSIFEQACPHKIAPPYAAWDSYRYYVADYDTAAALKSLQQAYELAPQSELIWAQWAYYKMREGEYSRVLKDTVQADSSLIRNLIFSDATFMKGNQDRARRMLAHTDALLREAPDSLLQRAIRTRYDSLQWARRMQIHYGDSLFGPEKFQELTPVNQVKQVQKAFDLKNWKKITEYGQILSQSALDNMWFDTYLNLIDYVSYFGKYKVAADFIQNVRSLKLRPRYQQRLAQEQAWLRFVKQHKAELFPG